MARSQGEELHQGGCLPQAPGILGNGSRIYTNPKATEQPHSYDLAFLARWRPELPDALRSRRRPHPLPSPLLEGSVFLRSTCSFSYKIGAYANESGGHLLRRRGLGALAGASKYKVSPGRCRDYAGHAV